MKILILGKTGMLGHVVYNHFLEKGYEVYGTSSKEDIIFDANNMETIKDIITDIKPDIIINCIGILNKMAEDNHVLALKLNGLLPHYLDELSKTYNFKLVHISTDCVFEGTTGKYDEKSVPDAKSFYGRSKAIGEINNDRNLTLRTSIIGPDNNKNGIGLFQWFITQQNEVFGYNKVIWTGVTTIELAKCIEKAIKENLTGLHHVVNNDFISKKELLELFKKYFNKEINININDDVVSNKTLIASESYNFNVPTYEQMIIDMRLWVLNHKELYPIIINNCDLK